MASDSKSSGKGLQRHLPPALQLHILSLLPPNHCALSGRLVSPDAANSLCGPEHCTASLSQPLPPHAVPWAVEAGQQHVRQLPFRHKRQLLCTAAASGSEVNLEVALALLQPSIFPELLQSYNSDWAYMHVGRQANPGVAAVRAGHPQLLGWLLRHCPGLVERDQVITTAATYCDLTGLQAAFRAFSANPAGQSIVLDYAAGSETDAVAKMEWLLRVSGTGFRLQRSTAGSAACWGDLGRLRWLRERGCPMGSQDVLFDAVQHADLAVAQWLVDEAGCELPDADTDDDTDDGGGVEVEAEREKGWGSLLEASARSSDGLAKVGWLQQRRGGPLQTSHWQRMALAAAREGRVDMVQHALSVLGPAGGRPEGLARAAVHSGSVPKLPMLQFLHHTGVAFDHEAYLVAAMTGSLAMVQWLACSAAVSAEALQLHHLITEWPRGPTAMELLQAVQLLVEKGGWRGWGTTSGLVAAAAGRGDLALVQYLLQQLRQHQPEYQPDGVVGLAAAHGGCKALLEWLAEQHPGCLTVPPGDSSPYVPPAVAGDLGTLTALRRLGVPWGAENVVTRVLAWHGFAPAALHWLVEQGAPVGSRRDMQQALGRLGEGVDRRIKAWLQRVGECTRKGGGEEGGGGGGEGGGGLTDWGRMFGEGLGGR